MNIVRIFDYNLELKTINIHKMHLEFWNQHSPSLIFQFWEAIIFLTEIICTRLHKQAYLQVIGLETY
jgi:hypothetical protein